MRIASFPESAGARVYLEDFAMNQVLRKLWLGGAVGALLTLLAMSALGEPPFLHDQNRSYGNSVGAGICLDIENGTSCRDINVWENYDIRGTYVSTAAIISLSQYQYNPDDGSWLSGWRYVSCPIDQHSMSTRPNGASLDTITLDPAGVGCETYGFLDTWDPINGYQSVPWPFPGPRSIAGEWAAPFSYGKSISNQRNTNYDGWSGITTNNAQQCTYSWGESMTSGGFTFGLRSFAFEGPEGAAWSAYAVNSCNNHDTQH